MEMKDIMRFFYFFSINSSGLSPRCIHTDNQTTKSQVVLTKVVKGCFKQKDVVILKYERRI